MWKRSSYGVALVRNVQGMRGTQRNLLQSFLRTPSIVAAASSFPAARTPSCPLHSTLQARYFHAHAPIFTPAASSSQSIPSSSSTASSSSSASSSTASGASSSVQLYSSFPELGGLSAPLLSRLKQLNVVAPTPIQQRVIPFLTRWSHTPLLLQSPTGTGKSLAFLLPLLAKVNQAEQERIKRGNKARTQIRAVIICPSQELVFQTQSQLLSLLSSDASAKSDPSFVGLCIGGFEALDVQRADLVARPPAILIGTPKRLNSVLFPQFETHAVAKRPTRRRDRVELRDPELDEGGEEAMDAEEEENERQGKGESHINPNYRDSPAARKALEQAEYNARNNIAVPRGGSIDQEDDEDDGEERREHRSPQPPRRRAPSVVNQRFLHAPTPRGHAMALRTPAKSILQELLYLVVDEADDVLKPISSRSGEQARLNRARHPKPSNLLVRALTLLNPAAQLVAASATINGPLRSLVFRLGFKNPKAVHIKIEPRVAAAAAAQQQAMAGRKAEEQQVIEEEISAQQIEEEISADDSAYNDEAPSSSSSTLPAATTQFPNSLDASSPSAPPALPLAAALMYHTECPPNLKHFFVLAPSFYAWRTGRYDQPQEFPRKLAFDSRASAEKRQAVHEFNVQITHALRRNAFIVDKIASLRLLLDQFHPKCPILLVDEEKWSLQHIDALCSNIGLRPAIAFHHLSDPSPLKRSAFLRDVQSGGKFDLLLVGLNSVRGLDLPMCDVVFFLDCCTDPSLYLHGAGRTGRLGREGSVISLLHPEELKRFDVLQNFMPETFKHAQQILLPAAKSPDTLKLILREYERTAGERETRGKELNEYRRKKMKKKVRDDETVREMQERQNRKHSS